MSLYLGSENPNTLVLKYEPTKDEIETKKAYSSLENYTVFKALDAFLSSDTTQYRYLKNDAITDPSVLLEGLQSFVILSEITRIFLVGEEMTKFFLSYESFDDVKFKVFEMEVKGLKSKLQLIPISEFNPSTQKAEEYIDLVANNLPGNEYLRSLKVMNIDEFIAHLDKVLDAYNSAEINDIGFDTETTSLNPHEKKGNITTFSIYDKATNIAAACFFRSPEKWIPQEKMCLLNQLPNISDKLVNSNLWEDRVALTELVNKWLEDWTSLEFHPYEYTMSIDEDAIKANMIAILQAIKAVRARTWENRTEQIVNLFKEIQPLYEKEINIYNNGYKQSDFDRLLSKMSEVLNTVPIIGQNIKFDITYLLKHNIGNKLKVRQDTLADAIFDFDAPKKKDLGTLVSWYTDISEGWKDAMQADERVKRPKTGTRYDRVEYEKHSSYAATDGITAWKVGQTLQDKLKDKTVWFKLRPYMMKGLRAFSRAEIFGVTVDVGAYKILEDAYIQQMADSIEKMSSLPIARKILDKFGIEKVNPAVNGANSHSNNILFSKDGYNLESIESTTAGYPSLSKAIVQDLIGQLDNSLNSFEIRKQKEESGEFDKDIFLKPLLCANSDTLLTEERIEVLKEAREYLQALGEWKEVQRLNSTYIGGIKFFEENLNDPSTYYTEFNIVGATVTGRLSSGFHGQPRESDIKKLWTSAWASTSQRSYADSQIPGEKYLAPPPPFVYDIEFEE